MMDGDGAGAGKVTDYVFVKALEDLGRVVLVRSMTLEARIKRKEAIKAMIDYFAENYDFTYTESKIMKRINNLKQRLKEKFVTQRMGEADEMLMKLLTQVNADNPNSADDGGANQITNLQFVKTLSECGRALLNNSRNLDAQNMKRGAAKSMRDAFADDFGIRFTEGQIFKKLDSMRRHLKRKLVKNELGEVKLSLTKADIMLKKLLKEEKFRKQRTASTSSDSDSDTSSSFHQVFASITERESDPISVKEENHVWCPSSEPLVPLASLNYDFNLSNDDFNQTESISTADLQQKVLTKQLNVFQKQMEVLDAQKEVYLLKKELLLAKLKARK